MTSRRSAVLIAVGAALIVVVAAVLVIALRPGPTPRPKPPVERVVTILEDDAELLHRTPAQIDASLDDIKRLGVDWVRVTAGWSVLAPDPDATKMPGAPFDPSDPKTYPQGNWDALDRLVREAGKRGLGIDLDIAFWAPRWAVSRGVAQGRERYGIDPDQYARFATAVARRYPHAAAFTLWNEPNHNVFMLPQFHADLTPASPAEYRAMVQAAYPAIKRVAPTPQVLIGGLSSTGAKTPTNGGSRMSPLTFLRAFACVDQALKPVTSGDCKDFKPIPGDGWAHHPYDLERAPDVPAPNPEDIGTADLGRLSDTLDKLFAAGRFTTGLPIYLTEFGYQTNPPDPTRHVTPDQQSRWLAQAEMIERSVGAVRGTSQFLLRDLPKRPGPTLKDQWRDYQTGLRTEDGTAKPAYDLYRYPLVVTRRSAHTVDVWALYRPGHGVRSVKITDGHGHVLASGDTDSDGVFARNAVRADPSGRFAFTDAGGHTLSGLTGADR